jgi:murein L,D-transpeptidase YafK
MKLPKATPVFLLSGLFAAAIGAQQGASLREQQLRYPRVRTASTEKDASLRAAFEKKNLAYPPKAILLRAFKKESLLELWVADSERGTFTLAKIYSICATSGVLGPKRRFGDVQVPEGFYDLDWFNPQSNFYLSMHISYPNASDRILGSHSNPGGDIFLHGNCVTIGCIPIQDDGIKEVYWLAVLARTSGQRHLPIEIFPARLTDDGLRALAQSHRDNADLIAFWDNLKAGYDAFENTHKLPSVKVAPDGRYVFTWETARRDTH